MPQWFLLALYVFYVCWLCAMLLFLYAIWRNGVKRSQTVDQALITAAHTSAEAAKIAAEAARALALHSRESAP